MKWLFDFLVSGFWFWSVLSLLVPPTRFLLSGFAFWFLTAPVGIWFWFLVFGLASRILTATGFAFWFLVSGNWFLVLLLFTPRDASDFEILSSKSFVRILLLISGF